VRVVFELAEIPDWPVFLERIERMRPDFVVLDVTRLHEPAGDVIAKIRKSPGQPAVFALHTVADPQAILSAMRAGAAEYLCPPLRVPLAAALQRLEQSRIRSSPFGSKNGKTLGFLSAKGGCGATTLACHAAACFGREAKEDVLLVDLDTQCGIIGYLTKSKTHYSVADAVDNLNRLDPSYWKALVSRDVEFVDVLPSALALENRAVPLDSLKQIVSFARELYAVSVFDLGRGLSVETMGILEGMDEIYLATLYDVPALHQAKWMTHYFLDHGIAASRLRLIVNRRPRHMDLTLDEIGKMLGVPVFAAIRDESEELDEAYTAGRLAAGDSSFGRAVGEFVHKMAGNGHATEKRGSFLGL
jgi:pilus assembly protein CpaE